MFGVGIFELVLIFVVIVLVLGVDKTLRLARRLGVFISECKKEIDNFKNDL